MNAAQSISPWKSSLSDRGGAEDRIGFSRQVDRLAESGVGQGDGIRIEQVDPLAMTWVRPALDDLWEAIAVSLEQSGIGGDPSDAYKNAHANLMVVAGLSDILGLQAARLASLEACLLIEGVQGYRVPKSEQVAAALSVSYTHLTLPTKRIV